MAGNEAVNPSYGAVDSSIPMEPLDLILDTDYPFGESEGTFSTEFWDAVLELEKESSDVTGDAVTKVRVKKLTEACTAEDKDVLIDLIVTKYDTYFDWSETNEQTASRDAFLFELYKLTSVILKEDFESDEPKYLSKLWDDKTAKPDDKGRTILHMAAERNLTEVMQDILTKDKGLINLKDSDGKLPLYYALKGKDDAASMLILQMEKDKVRKMFEDKGESDYQFCNIIEDGGMNKTVEAILDCLMTRAWLSKIPSEDEAKEKGITLPNMPFRYNVFYRLLDGAGESRKEKSGLQLIVERSKSLDDTNIRHPVVQMLMRSKWRKFGKFWITMELFFYLAFVAVMSAAMLVPSSTHDRREYRTHLDKFRFICEVATLLFTLYFILCEIDDAKNEGMSYVYDPFNYLDLPSLALIIIVIPLRCTGHTTAEFGVSSAAYLMNFFRIGKLATAYKPMSVYIKTFARIIQNEISKFLGIFLIFMFAFSGSVYLAMKACKSKLLYRGYSYVVLQELRGISEENGLAEEEQYKEMHIVVIILVICNLFCCVVVLNNILIGQIGKSYLTAQKHASARYDIDRTTYVAILEGRSLYKWFKRGDSYVDNEVLTRNDQDVLEDWAMCKECQQIETK